MLRLRPGAERLITGLFVVPERVLSMSEFEESDTIAAIATAPGAAGVAVVRLSGSEAWQIAERVIRGGNALSERAAGTFFHGKIVDPQSGELVDDGVILLFRAPASFTGEDVVELQGHGGVVAPNAVLRVVLAAGARLAQPGEFTRRAFLHGRLDLTQAEAVLDLIQARTGRAAQVARTQLDGALGAACSACYEEVADLCAEVDARLDFEPDELPQRLKFEEVARISQVRTRLASLLATWREGHLLRSGALVVIGGCPNAGKSSLMNALLGWNRAIVSSTPGTTRDTIEERLDLNGIPVRLVDTAGLREASCPVEQEGVRRAGSVLAQADLMIYLLDGSRPLAEQHPHLFEEAFSAEVARVIVVLNKADLPKTLTVTVALQGLRRIQPATIMEISALTGQGLAELRQAMVQKLGLEQQAPLQPTVSERHRNELRLADQALSVAQTLLGQDDQQLVLAAVQLRAAAEALGRITGNHYSQELLDRIFSRFCLGK